MKAVQSLLPGLNSILKVRGDLGADLKAVSIITRTWSGNELGAGDAGDTETAVTPAPRVLEYGASHKIQEGGAIQVGDIKLTGISKATFPTQDLIDCAPTANNVERYFKVGDHRYRVLSVREKHLTWEVHLRKIT